MLGFLTKVFTGFMDTIAWICFIVVIIAGVAVGNLAGYWYGEFNFWLALLTWVVGIVLLSVFFGVFGAFLTLVKNTGEISDKLKRLDDIFYGQEKIIANLSSSVKQPIQTQQAQQAQQTQHQKEEIKEVSSCKNCGKQLGNGAKFCVGCGTKCG